MGMRITGEELKGGLEEAGSADVVTEGFMIAIGQRATDWEGEGGGGVSILVAMLEVVVGLTKAL